jgi:hypothetical protein
MSDFDSQAFFESFLPQPGESTIEEWTEYGIRIRRKFQVQADGSEVLVSEDILP